MFAADDADNYGIEFIVPTSTSTKIFLTNANSTSVDARVYGSDGILREKPSVSPASTFMLQSALSGVSIFQSVTYSMHENKWYFTYMNTHAQPHVHPRTSTLTHTNTHAHPPPHTHSAISYDFTRLKKIEIHMLVLHTRKRFLDCDVYKEIKEPSSKIRKYINYVCFVYFEVHQHNLG
jgi:hypothetical protein